MFNTLPDDARPVLDWTWEQLAPYYEDLQEREITAGNVDKWLADWSRLNDLYTEIGNRLQVAYDLDTRDQIAEERYLAYYETTLPPVEKAEKVLKEKLLNSGQTPAGMAIPLRRLQVETDLFQEENLPLLVDLNKHSSQYHKIIGSQTTIWEGEEIPLLQLRPILNDPDRSVRERVWRLAVDRQLEDRQALNDLWQTMLPVRRQVAANAGCTSYREFIWRKYHRFDYTPADAREFQEAIAEVCVPAATRIYRRHQQRLGLDSLRPWDLSDGTWGRPVDPPGLEPLRPYADAGDFLAKSGAIFRQVDPNLALNFDVLVNEQMLDVENRAGKAPGGYCTYFPAVKRPFIFMNSVGMHDDVQTMMHEAGHAFHAFAITGLPYHPQRDVPMEFAEVASMAMELLVAPYLSADGRSGINNTSPFYSPAEAARARNEHLENMVLFWPYMAVVDAFQHWAYTHPEAAANAAECDACWSELWARYLPGVDWSGLEDAAATGWQRKLHIFTVPFYYIEYGLAALGAAQVWKNALENQEEAVQRYRQALALGGTKSLPELFATAGARFAFDAATLQEVVSLIEAQINGISKAPGISGTEIFDNR